MSATPLGKLLQDEIKEMARWIENNLSEEPVRLNKVETVFEVWQLSNRMHFVLIEPDDASCKALLQPQENDRRYLRLSETLNFQHKLPTHST